jgi:hypothetical protein
MFSLQQEEFSTTGKTSNALRTWKKSALLCAIGLIGLAAATGTFAFLASERHYAQDIITFDLGCIKEHGMSADCEVADHGHTLHDDLSMWSLGEPNDLSKAMAKFQASPMPKLRASHQQSLAHNPSSPLTQHQQKLLDGTGGGLMKTIALTALQSSRRGSDIQMQLVGMEDKKNRPRLVVKDKDVQKRVLDALKGDVLAKAKTLAGVTEPLGFFDPLGFCSDVSEGKLCFFREVELKHGRVAMLATLGFLVGEQFHPLFGGDIDVPSYIAFQQTPLQTFWPAVVTAIAIPEIFSVFDFNPPKNGGTWTMKTDRVAGDLGFDPLNLKPSDPKEFKDMQTKELNNGRLAMIAAAGMVAQELVSGQKLF